MTHSRFSLAWSLAIPATLLAAAASATDCPGPPWNAWPSGGEQLRCSITANPCTMPSTCPSISSAMGGPQSCTWRGTYDQQYVNESCLSASAFRSTWNGLHMAVSDWDEGCGLALHQGSWIPSCDVDDPLTRLLNAAHLVRRVQEHAILFGFHRWVHDADDDLGALDVFTAADGPGMKGRLRGLWWIFATSHEPDEWVPSPDNGAEAATNWDSVDDEIELHRTGAYRMTALNRAGLIVHETVHEDVEHLNFVEVEASGSPCTSSCDDRFARYNATTLEIYFLYDAATTYDLTEVDGKPVRLGVVSATGPPRQCRFNPTFSDYERNRALASANSKFDTKFVFGPMRSLNRLADAAAADRATRATWNCDTCDVSEWTFDPALCTQTACNEILAPGNAAINDANAAACGAYNAQVAAGGNSPEAIALAAADRVIQPCHGPQEASLVAYCDARKAAANHVSEIDPCDWLEGVYMPGLSKSICIQQFCHERFEADHAADGAVQWTPSGDPYGCLDAICADDGESCSQDLSEAACKQLFIAAHGHPDFYAESCTIDGCRRLRAQCISDKLVIDPDAWEFPEPVPSDCQILYQTCKVAEEVSTEGFLSLQELAGVRIPDTGPVEGVINPGLMVYNAVIDYQEALASGAGADELETIRRFLFSEPEMLRAMFDLAPGRFVALFGTEGFEELIGPQIQQVTPEPIAPADLIPEGRGALAEIEALIESTPPEELVSPFGKLRSQHDQQ